MRYRKVNFEFWDRFIYKTTAAIPMYQSII
jgi:hypothetical protein